MVKIRLNSEEQKLLTRLSENNLELASIVALARRTESNAHIYDVSDEMAMTLSQICFDFTFREGIYKESSPRAVELLEGIIDKIEEDD